MADNQDDDMYLFQGELDRTPSAFAGQEFDNFLANSPGDQSDDLATAGFLNPSDLAIKQENGNSPRRTRPFPRSSRSSASSSSSSHSRSFHNRNISSATTSTTGAQRGPGWGSGVNGMSVSTNEQFFDDSTMTGLEQDYEVSNQQMSSAFDFETAASTPSGFDSMSMIAPKSAQPLRRTVNMGNINQGKTSSPRLPAGQAQFFLGSREASPLNAMLPTAQPTTSWTKHSPSSGLEETFNHMGMNGDSPGNATFSPNIHVNFGSNTFNFDPDSSGTPSSFAKDISSPPSTVTSTDGNPTLHIYPTSLKSRVETQIPIKMTLYPLPPGARKLRLPTYTVSKPKFLAKPEVDRSPDILELNTALVCTSAMQDPMRKQRALARARGERLSPYAKPSPASSSGSTSSKDDEEKPLNGGEVRICTGCIQRERKRASRKKQKKPEEEEMFQKDEEKRVVVFNTNEIKDWVEVTKDNQPSPEASQTPPPGTMQVELPMRIACYCRHQNEKMGFMVIFTIKDHREKVVAQAMTNSIMITDDHKTHNVVPSLSGNPHLPGAGVFTPPGMDMAPGEPHGSKLFKQSYSTPDLTRLQQGFNPQFAMGPVGSPFAIPTGMSATTSATLTPRNLSRPASPTGPSGPATKRRKPSGSGKLPSGLTMTRLDTGPPPGPATMPNTAVSSPYAPNMPSFLGSSDRNFTDVPSRRHAYGTSPPTPNGTDGVYANAINRSFSLENLPRQAMMSAPPSRQPSRPGSPTSGRNSFGQGDSTFPQAVNQQLLGQHSRRPTPVIHKLVPAEGSTSGGTEVTLLGNGFYQGLEVMFGDTEATTTTFWGEKCLNCIAPPAVQPGMVAVVFKHEHPHYSTMQGQSHGRPSVFTYIDDREVELLRLALRTIGKNFGTEDPYAAAQQVLQQSQPPAGMFPQAGSYGMNTGHQRAASGYQQRPMNAAELETSMLGMLRFASQGRARGRIHLDLRRPNGLGLLHLAASMGMTRLVTALVSLGANPNMLDNGGHTPMHHAAMNGHEQIILRLQATGADHGVRSVRNFVPADLATTLPAYQAAIRTPRQHRSRSAGPVSRPGPSASTSSSSLRLFWDRASNTQDGSESDDFDDDSDEASVDDGSFSLAERRVPLAQPERMRTQTAPPVSRRQSRQLEVSRSDALAGMSGLPSEQSDTPSALISAWRQLLNVTQLQQQQLAEQLQYFQEHSQWTMPALPALPGLPDYQAHPMVRRVSALFPHRPNFPDNVRGELGVMSAKWNDDHKGESSSTAAPPSYEEIFPGRSNTTDDVETKKLSVLQAAADAAVDQHYERHDVDSPHKVATPAAGLPTDQREAGRIGLMQDRKLFFFWIPLLAVVLALMARNSGIWQEVPLTYTGTVGAVSREVVEPL